MNTNFNTCKNLAPLASDTLSFGAMKKNEFSGVDLLVVNKFKAPVYKFNDNNDLQAWCTDEINKIKDKDYKGRQPETTEQRKYMLKEWFDYVLEENDGYTSTMALLILDGITKDLSEDNDTIPPVLNKRVLADTMAEIQDKARANKNFQANFSKMYQINLQNFYTQDIEETDDNGVKMGGKTGWIVIPSQEHDPENFNDNVNKLKALSYKTWCTKSFNAEPYLSEGDFHVYLDNGKPKLGVRFVGDEIQEIQGERNNGLIPADYYDEAMKHIENNELKLSNKGLREIKDTKELLAKIKDTKQAIKDSGIDTTNPKDVYEFFGMECTENDDGTMTLSEYKPPENGILYSDIGINEEVLFKKANIKYIEEDADFYDSQITSLANLKLIGGDANFRFSQITSLANLKLIGGDVYFMDTKIKDLGNLQSIGKNANFQNSKIKDLGNLQSIGKNANFEHSQITSLGNLQSIGGYAVFQESQITSLGNLQSIGGNANFFKSKVTSLGNLQSIGKNAYFQRSQIKDLGNLQSIGENAYIGNSKLVAADFNNIKVGGDIITKAA